MKRSIRYILWAGLLLAVTAAAWLAVGFRDGYDAVLLMADLAGVEAPLPDRRPEFERQAGEYVVDGRRHAADVYLPQGVVGAGIVLVPGAAEGGRDDPRLVEFAGALARSGFAVVVPDIPALRELRFTSASAQDVADAVRYLREGPLTAPWLRPGSRAGIGAFSVASGLAVLAALEGEGAGRVDFLLLVGGYYDLRRTLTWLTTGMYETEQQVMRREPDAYGKWVYALSNASLLKRRWEREALADLARARLADPSADDAKLAARLGPRGQAVYDFIRNTDPQQAAPLMAALPEPVRAEIDALDLAGRDLSGLGARLILVHGVDDDIVPWSESVALAGALPPGRARVFLLQGLHHVDRDFRGADAWRGWRAMRLLLAQRD